MKKAVVKFPSPYSYSENNITGCISFTQQNNCSVVVEVKLNGLPPGIHGFHIHEYPIKQNHINKMKTGEKIPNLCSTLGGHFNPFNTHHGSFRLNTQRHAGDLINNLHVDRSQSVNIIFVDPLISLNESDINYIVNKSIVIHEKPDDEGLPGMLALYKNEILNKNEKESLKTGNAGKRIACGNIMLIN